MLYLSTLNHVGRLRDFYRISNVNYATCMIIIICQGTTYNKLHTNYYSDRLETTDYYRFDII